MPASTQNGFDSAAPRSPDQVQFFTQHYHLLKGLCYAPVGGLLLVSVLGMLLVRPRWLGPDGSLHLLTVGLLVAAVPWMWHMHRRYEAAYGRVRHSKGQSGGRIGQSSPSLLTFGGVLLFGLCWIAVGTLYIPHHTTIGDNHYPVIMTGWLLLLGTLRAPFARLRWIYGISGGLLFVATLLPLMTDHVILVQALNYGLLGAVVAGVGVYNHRLLVDTLGPVTAGEGESR